MRKLLTCLAVIAAFVHAAATHSNARWQSDINNGRRTTVIGDEHWTAEMGWRYVSYTEGGATITLQIEPMIKGGDLVYVPAEAGWLRTAPDWARQRRAEILSRLKSVKWNRKLKWPESDKSSVNKLSPNLIPGSLESTPGGVALEAKRMFDPGSDVSHERAHEMWYEAARMFVKQARGTATIFMTSVVPDSVFQVIELPELKKNPNVTLIFK